MVHNLVLYTLLPTSKRAYCCKTIVILMEGALRYFSQVSRSGLDVIVLNPWEHDSFIRCQAGLLGRA